jgi:BLOC-1 related complex subunit 5
MGSEQSNAVPPNTNSSSHINRMNRPVSADAFRIQQLQRGHTIAAPSTNDNLSLVDAGSPPLDSRPTSPPMSVCSDSELPYISYTGNPIGGK